MALGIPLLDANVLWSAVLRDTLLRAAQRGLFDPIWRSQIIAETLNAVQRQRPDRDPARLARTFDLMNAHFPSAAIEGYEPLVAVMRNDPKDRHVLAAAVPGRAQTLVTFNRKDFPPHACQPHGIEVLSPDEFLSGAVQPAGKATARTGRQGASWPRRGR